MGVKEQGVRLNNKGEVNTSLYSWGWDGKRQNLGTPTPAVQLTVHHVNTGWRDKTQSTHSNAHESLSIFIILKNSSILKFSVMICPMTKHFSQFPFSQSCIKFQVVWFLPGPGEGERWGRESGVCLSFYKGIHWFILRLVCSPELVPWFAAELSLVPKSKFPMAATHVLKGHGLICCYTGVNSGGRVGGDLWSQVQENYSFVEKLTFVPFIVSCSLNPPVHPISDMHIWHFLDPMWNAGTIALKSSCLDILEPFLLLLLRRFSRVWLCATP